MTVFQIKRAYEPPSPADGYRVLVDRLWPRGLAKHDAALDEWCKDVAPSADLRKWFGHEPARFARFTECYRSELAASGAAVELKNRLSGHETITLIYAAKDQDCNHAIVLREVLAET